MTSYLEFEKPLAELERRISDLRSAADREEVELDIDAEVAKLEDKAKGQLSSIYKSLTPWQKTQVARHPSRPHFGDYVAHAFSDFMPLGGDRAYGDDQAILGGFATLDTPGGGRRVMLIGHEKGNDTQSRLKHNFGMGKPEGYRKAIRLMELAGRFGLPVVTLVDTSGAFPGIEAEERGQAEAIARATEACLDLPVPMVACIVGEGGSGGAVALASAERVLMMEHAVYSVISPEGCASILWRTAEKASEAAEAMKVTAQDLAKLGVVDRIVTEPLGGAHRDPVAASKSLGAAIDEELAKLSGKTPQELRTKRAERFIAIGGLA
ncbi:acetyl-CoA carboxylase carboxyltransferase subunit alpha [Croceicoccus naphthovorans]|uniref:Acetyl-coenzyme A carboxylase carboxyl transferase subunit alpha n=1 Tax=Croceicoccus naphthovorans TaxID=1348774 RepID=A0A0G3XGR4_9SPHN|nr:acetyl-CoA carboxylase carboxyltransferase subunit alpha [Croceicoccus naphthovorans]AKM10397.1 acetyl-CoA carboxylase subunit alpha [Croceicoccus naphthovorans]MBB3990095.1 acetyl-CoA carboxylase carboxyl transferase subunit alpha [Croceicoccus naphthovorans]